METGKPLISILMAVYEPRLDWLKEQLESLEAQTYPNLRLYVRDDCSPTVPFEQIQALVKDCIRSFPYEVKRNEENLGSNLTFERLTGEAEGKYFAYCDQDDIWLPEKLGVLQEKIEQSGALLVCSDMFIIDGKGKRVADSIMKVRRHHKFCGGENLFERLLVHNFVVGCTMLIGGSLAKASIPFCPYMVHDHYLALYASVRGRIVSLESQMIYYRIHGSNQTGIMSGVTDRVSYLEQRINLLIYRMDWIKTHMIISEQQFQIVENCAKWANARRKNWLHCGGQRTIIQYRKFSNTVSLAELILCWVSTSAFSFVIRLAQKNVI